MVVFKVSSPVLKGLPQLSGPRVKLLMNIGVWQAEVEYKAMFPVDWVETKASQFVEKARKEKTAKEGDGCMARRVKYHDLCK